MRSFKYFSLIVFCFVFFACKRTPQSTTIALPEKKTEQKNQETQTKETETKPTKDSASTVAKKPLKDTLTIIGVGDIMLGTTYPSPTEYLAPDDGKYLLEPVAAILRSGDLTFGNHEGTLFDGKGIPKKCSDSSKCYAFKSPTRYVNYLKESGFDIMSVANNHSGDFGPEGRASTIRTLWNAGIGVAGTPDQSFVIAIVDSLRIGMAAFSPNTGTCRIEEIEAAKKLIRRLDTLCDITIVSFHGGGEGRNFQHVTRQTEYFVGENRGNVYQFAHSLIDCGADIVFGHGPHVTRAIELYKNKIVAYSLGNFCTYHRFNLKDVNGIAPILKVKINREGDFVGGEIIPIVQEGEGGPKIDINKGAILKIKELTLSDFPETPLKISDSGQIMKK